MAVNIRRFTGESLREVAFPLGGIGTGTVALGGRGNLRDWEIFNHPGKGKNLPYTFFSIWAKPEGDSPVARVLERRLMPPYHNGFGLPTSQVSGLPRLKEATFTGLYPIAKIEFADDALPLHVGLEAYNPFIPMNDRDSGLPIALFTWTLRNTGRVPVETTVCLSLLNACGYDGRAGLGNRHHAMLGKNLNEFVRENGLSGIRMSTEKYASDHIQFGTMAMATSAENVTWRTRWERAGWWDDAQSFWDDFAEDGLLPNSPDADLSPDGQTDVGSLGVRVTVNPGEDVSIPFTVAWCFPNLANHWNQEEAVKGKRLGNWYSKQWPDAWSAINYAHENRVRLENETRLYVESMAVSTLPPEAIDAASANASTMRTTTCLRTEDGRFNAFEGCGDETGCCPMNCTHVWNYEQAVAHLFPALERTVRRTDFTHNTRQNGDMAFRTLLPLVDELWAFKPAADGQMGTVMKVYREWLQCGDRQFLEEMWPGVKRAVEYAWRPGSWDADKDGVMEGEQHNTYDIEFYGPNTMMGTFYLGALRAAEEMARVLGHTSEAKEYRAVYENGREKYSNTWFNGEYFDQQVIPPAGKTGAVGVADNLPSSLQGDAEPRYQYGTGCLADQMLGQWFARVVGLGDILPHDKVRATLAAIFKHNWKEDLSTHATVQRVYALNDESGLLLCTWPNGGRPTYPFPYADEVWTGIEYQVAAHCIYEGLVEEGLSIVKGVRDRHDGVKRNPWNEFECGHHYARAMASWSVILALSGYRYNACEGMLAFDPRIHAEDFRTFFSAGTAWGLYSQTREAGIFTATLNPRWGELTLQSLELNAPAGVEIAVTLEGAGVQATNEDGAIIFASPVKIAAGQQLIVELKG